MYGTCFASLSISFIFLPMKRLTEKKVFSGLTTPCRLAICKEHTCQPSESSDLDSSAVRVACAHAQREPCDYLSNEAVTALGEGHD